MTDDRFRLTALDARRWDFGNALRGYDRARVDAFRDQVAEELESMARANQELETKVSNFLEQLRVYRDRDKALNEALVSAQQLRGEIRQQAEREAQLMLREAQGEADRIVGAVQGDLRRAEEELQSLWRTRKAFLAQMRTLVERQATEISAAEGAAPPVIGRRSDAPVAPRAPQLSVAPRETPAEAEEPFTDASAADALAFQINIAAAERSEVAPDLDAADVPPVRPSMPTPSWLDAVSDEDPK
jgi:cell division initiation protein